MKSLMRNMAFLAVMLLYVISTMGYGVHKCAEDGTASLIFLFAESECEHHHGDQDHEHNGCCSTDVYVITEDQTASQDNFDLAPQMTLLASSSISGGELILPSSQIVANTASFLYRMHPKDAPLAVLCTFRI